MNMLEGCRGRTLAGGMAWLNAPEEWEAGADGLRVALRVKCDFFRPHAGEARDDAHLLHARLAGDFALHGADRGRARQHLRRRWPDGARRGGPVGQALHRARRPGRDQGRERRHAPLVRRCRSLPAPEPSAWLRITRKGAQFGLHWSEDGRVWRFVRAFPLELPAEVAAGALAQAPRAPGGSVLFASLAWSPSTAADFRSGE